MHKKKRSVIVHSQKGQALLIIVLIMVVSLTVGLSLALRSITAVRTATEEDNSQRAFSAAEAGIERLLKNITPILTPVSLSNGASIQKASSNPIVVPSGGGFFLRNGNTILQDDAADIWLVPHNADDTLNLSTPWQPSSGSPGSIRIFWGESPSPCSNPALEIIVLTGTSPATAVSRRIIVDSNCNRINGTVTPPSATGTQAALYPNITTKVLYTRYNFTLNDGLMIKVIPLFGSSPMVITTDPGTFPPQGKIIDSIGQAGGTTRKISFYKGYPELPAEFFQYILFSTHP